MTKIQIVPDQVYSLAKRFRIAENELREVIRIMDQNLGNLEWESNLKGPIMQDWNKEKASLKTLAITSKALGTIVHNQAALFEQVDSECKASLNKIQPTLDNFMDAVNKLFSTSLTLEELNDQISLTQDRLDEANNELHRISMEANQALERTKEAWLIVADRESVKDVTNAGDFLTSLGIEDGPSKTLLSIALVTGEDFNDVVGFNALLNIFLSYKTGSPLPPEDVIHAEMLVIGATNHILHSIVTFLHLGEKAIDYGATVGHTILAMISSSKSNKAVERFVEAQDVVFRIEQQLKSLNEIKQQIPQ